MKIRTLFVIGLSAILLSGCDSYKKVPYLQDTYVKNVAKASHSLYDVKIMPKDLLTITVNTTDPEAGEQVSMRLPILVAPETEISPQDIFLCLTFLTRAYPQARYSRCRGAEQRQ